MSARCGTTVLADGFVISAPRSGSGKTLVTLGLIAALRARGLRVAPAKSGPDYIDAAIAARVAGRSTVNLDDWAMTSARLRALADDQAAGGDLLLVEGAMGLFDGAADARGSTGDVAAALGLPVILVVDAERQNQSIAPLVAGFAGWRADVHVAGIIANRVAGPRHADMLRRALEPLPPTWLGAIPRDPALELPTRHLGLVLPDEIASFDAVVSAASSAIIEHTDLEKIRALAAPLPSPSRGGARGGQTAQFGLPPLGQRISIARDDAFAFLYPHWLGDWRAQGADISFFSPLADEPPDAAADAVLLPGGYPELHGPALAAARRFKAGLAAARDRGALVYGECGGFMVLGRTLTDKAGKTHEMAGLLPLETTMGSRPVLGYRRLTHASPLPWPARLNGHEFHYSSATVSSGEPLFSATDALGIPRPGAGLRAARVMGSYAHVIDVG